jgi:hypothetical protein
MIIFKLVKNWKLRVKNGPVGVAQKPWNRARIPQSVYFVAQIHCNVVVYTIYKELKMFWWIERKPFTST